MRRINNRRDAELGLAVVGLILLLGQSVVAQRFDFGSGNKRVDAETIYSQTRGFGFEPGAEVECVERSCASKQPFYFSVAVPEGSYKVTVTFGGVSAATQTTVKAELRRLMLEDVRTAPNKFATRTFTVNVRRPQIAGGGEVKLKDREKTSEAWAWDEKLTLEFSNTHPAIAAIVVERVENLPVVYLLGDSTVCDQPAEPYSSWGQMLTRFLRPEVVVANHAESGESLRSSLGARRLDKVLSTIKKGDFLIIQYGHNDEKEKGEGVGAFTTYKSDLKRFVTAARERGATPILVTPVQRRTFDANNKITNSHGDYPEAVRQVAREENVSLIDLHAMSTKFYEALGPEKSKLAFKEGDGTHHNNYGSYELAKCVVEGLKHTGLAKFIVKDFGTFDPGKPDPVRE